MWVGHDDCGNGWIDGKSRRSSVLRTQRKRGGRNDLVGAIGKVAGHSSERTRPKIVKHTEAGAENGAPIRSPTQLISESQPWRHISIGCMVERSAARGQGCR